MIFPLGSKHVPYQMSDGRQIGWSFVLAVGPCRKVIVPSSIRSGYENRRNSDHEDVVP